MRRRLGLRSLGLVLSACAPAAACAEGSIPLDPRVAAYVEVPAGTFLMGCTAGQQLCDDDEAEHQVTLTRSFLIAETEVTQAQFEAALGYNPARFTDCGIDCPVESVSWHEAVAFANALSVEAGLIECYSCVGSSANVQCEIAADPYGCEGFRLLTEAEWEDAARCGEDLMFAGSNELSDVAWHQGNSGGSTHIVARKAPNACGLYDMSGNVWEWTQDWYADVSSEPVTDPSGPAEGFARVNKGGGWGSTVSYERVAMRHQGGVDAHTFSFGFRVGRLAE